MIVTTPPAVAPVGALRVRAETKGRARATARSWENMVEEERRHRDREERGRE